MLNPLNLTETSNQECNRSNAIPPPIFSPLALRGDEDGQYPSESERALVDKSRQQLDTQLSAAREGFEVAFVQYLEDTERTYDNVVRYYEGAMQLRVRATDYFADD